MANLKFHKNVPNIILKGVTTKTYEIIEEYEFECLTNIFIQEYSDYNIIILKTNIFDGDFALNNIKCVDNLILSESVYDSDCNTNNYKQYYKDMKLLLTYRDSKCGNVTDLYYIFASKDIKENSLKKELNWLLDREINQSMVENINNIISKIGHNVEGINNINYNLKEINDCLIKITI